MHRPFAELDWYRLKQHPLIYRPALSESERKKKTRAEVYLNELFTGWGKDFLFANCVLKACSTSILVNEQTQYSKKNK